MHMRMPTLHADRLSELAAAAVLPIIISDNWALPFHQLINWNDIAIVIAGSPTSVRNPQHQRWNLVPDVERLGSLLSSFSQEEVCERRARLFDIYHRYLKGPEEWARALSEIESQSPPMV